MDERKGMDIGRWRMQNKSLKPVIYECQRDRSVASAYQTALKKKDDIAIALPCRHLLGKRQNW